jgi:hypothetical protein
VSADEGVPDPVPRRVVVAGRHLQALLEEWYADQVADGDGVLLALALDERGLLADPYQRRTVVDVIDSL